MDACSSNNTILWGMMTVLEMPKLYSELCEADKNKICNGCGSKGLGGWLVPDTLWGLSMTEVCNIHDYMYYVGVDDLDKEAADLTMLKNMIKVIEQEGTKFWPIVHLRKSRAKKYYYAVKNFGDDAFYAGKRDY